MTCYIHINIIQYLLIREIEHVRVLITGNVLIIDRRRVLMQVKQIAIKYVLSFHK